MCDIKRIARGLQKMRQTRRVRPKRFHSLISRYLCMTRYEGLNIEILKFILAMATRTPGNATFLKIRSSYFQSISEFQFDFLKSCQHLTELHRITESSQ